MKPKKNKLPLEPLELERLARAPRQRVQHRVCVPMTWGQNASLPGLSDIKTGDTSGARWTEGPQWDPAHHWVSIERLRAACVAEGLHESVAWIDAHAWSDGNVI